MEIINVIITGLIAIAAFGTLYVQREHNKKSIVPLINIGYGDFENMLYVGITNVGIGPAEITDIEVYKEVPNLEKKNTLIDWLPMKLSKGAKYKFYASRYKDFFLSKGENYKLVEVEIDMSIDEAIEQRESIRQIMKDLYIKVSYKDIYGTVQKNCCRPLSYFGRTDNVN
ncbi:hypothetical protein GCM10027429_24050 [Marivirga atlantica]|jgi:hypothetical protein|uniref:Uncharacterized protein n=1 Tax=Marivirga atlantica TaxID=1548457 RepID=A0A937ALZ8_9BACT|nr:hypothetical protein [Marivirga atlantica]MBL0766003.1 hypothetical protein [Marivirga atlantica]